MLKEVAGFLGAIAVLCMSTSASSQVRSSDIIVTGYETVVMEQGKSNVQPRFTVLNRGTQTYTGVTLIYSRPSGLTPDGVTVTLDLRGSRWQAITLEPGMEVVLNPGGVSSGNYLRSSTNQSMITYSSEYYFTFSDDRGQTYSTQPQNIPEFVTVTLAGSPD